MKKINLDPKLWLIALLAIVGVLLMLFGGFASDKKSDGEGSAEASLDPKAYSQKVEEEIESLCTAVAGNRPVSAVVSLSGGYRSVFASDSQSSSSGHKNSTVLVGNGNSQGAVLVCYENPEISGVGVVISGSESEKIKNDVINLISAAFDVRTNKIHVAFGG